MSPYYRKFLIDGGELGTTIPISLNFLSKQKKMKMQLSAYPIMVIINPAIKMERKNIATAP